MGNVVKPSDQMSTQVPQRCSYEGEGGGEWCQCHDGECMAKKRATERGVLLAALSNQIAETREEQELPQGVY